MNESEVLYSSASDLLDRLGVNIEAPINLDKIVKDLGIVVEEDVSLDERGIVGEILFEDGNPIVKINPIKNDYPPRMRFTLAHEIGHYCLHSAKSKKGFIDSQKTMSRTESYWDPYESEANSFAAQLLMPKQLILTEGQKTIDKYKNETSEDGIPMKIFIDKIAEKFGVSSQAMGYRLKNLGIINNY